MSERVPEGWANHALGELGQVVGGGTPSSDTQSYWGGSVMWATPGEITKLKSRYIDNTLRTITEEGLKGSSAKLHPIGTILLTSRASIGYPAITNVPMATNQGFQSLRPNEKLDVEYGYQLLLNNRSGLERLSAGSTFLEISSKEISKYKLPIPPLPEQKKIASILTSVDEVIETTQKQIDKLQDLKKATMNELLTKGIGHTEFKDSELGRIPKSWAVVSVLDSNIAVLDGDRGNEYPKEKDFAKSGYCLFLSAKNVTKNGFRFNETVFISKDKDEKLRKGRLNRNDVIITTRGTVGNIAQYDTKISFDIVRINSGMAIIRNQEKRLSSDFLYHILSSEIITQQIENLTFGSAQPQLTIGTLNELKIPIPQMSEQLNIVHIFASILKDIENKNQKLAQTQSLKKSLMQDLLTGKVRVQVN